MPRFVLGFVLLIQAVACGGAPRREPPPFSHHRAESEPALRAVAAVHGGAGPWAVAGYRMGEFALRELGLSRGSFDLEVVHFTPESVQYSCIADGAAAATGASLGKLNLKLAEAAPPETRTTYRNKQSGQTLTLALTDEFKSRFSDVPREELGKAGREVMTLSDEQIFRVVP